MVDQSDLFAINMLNSELMDITQALEIFDAGGRIVNMTVASQEGQVPARMTIMQTATMTYPPQMVDAIKGFLSNRERDIRDQLAGLGVTGISENARRSAKTT